MIKGQNILEATRRSICSTVGIAIAVFDHGILSAGLKRRLEKTPPAKLC
jgi:hypothetical protein